MAAFDYLKTIISQYANSPVLLQLIEDFDECVDQSANIDAFYDMIWNVDTAQGYGLDVWGRIVGVTRVLQIATGSFFGYEEAGNVSAKPYGEAPYYAGAGSTASFNLSDDAFRTLIFAKALSNISDGSIIAINQLLMNLFPGLGNAYCTDDGNMTMTYHFSFAMTDVQQAIVSQSGVLPKPVGVAASVVIVP